MAKGIYPIELQKELVRLRTEENWSLSKISKMFKISTTKLNELLALNGIGEKQKSGITDKDIQNKIIDLYVNQHIGTEKISKEIGISTRRIALYLHEINKINDVGKTKFYSCNSNFFDVIDTEEKAYWLGVLYADGNISSSRSSVIFSSIDKEWIECFKKSVSATYPIHIETQKNFNKQIYKIVINDDTLHNDLIKHGCIANKSLKLTFPVLPEELIHHFIRGYFDGDGTVGACKNKSNSEYRILKAGICSGSKDFIDKLVQIIPIKNKNVFCRKRENQSRTGLLYQTNWSIKDTIRMYNYMYEGATVSLLRKRIIFEEYFKQRRPETIMKEPQTEDEKIAKRRAYYAAHREEKIAWNKAYRQRKRQVKG